MGGPAAADPHMCGNKVACHLPEVLSVLHVVLLLLPAASYLLTAATPAAVYLTCLPCMYLTYPMLYCSPLPCRVRPI